MFNNAYSIILLHIYIYSTLGKVYYTNNLNYNIYSSNNIRKMKNAKLLFCNIENSYITLICAVTQNTYPINNFVS